MEEKYKNKIVTIPNILSLFRLLLIPVIMWLYIVKKDPLWTTIILVLSGITDIVDGITNYKVFLSNLSTDDYLVIVGGDGTLNRFVNDTNGIDIPQEVLYFPAGSGNDFARELGTDGNPVVITQYLRNLPSVEVDGKHYRFINGVGFGIDGYCCQVGDELKKTPGKKVNYAAIAVKGLLLHFAARNAKVTVDGKEYAYKKAWLAPTMCGKYYGGGMIPTPGQDRSSCELSVMLFHGTLATDPN